MSITDELRAVAAKTECANGRCEKLYRGDLDHIADRIDAEHEKECSEAWMRGHDAWAAIDRSDEMAEHGWIRLPKDADGECIHIGDVMVYADGNTCPMKVVALVPPSVFLTEDGPRYADMCCHYKPPTVEDVLEEMYDALNNARIPNGSEKRTYEEIIAKYAAKLQLRGEDE